MKQPTSIALGLVLAALTLACGCTEPASADAPVATATPAATAAEPTPEPTPARAEAPEAEAPAPTRTERTERTERRPERRAGAPLRVHRFVVARDVVDREPVDAGETFAASDERLFAFFEFRNRGGDEQELSVTFEGPDGRTTGHVMLSVPADVWRWRTWAWTRGADEPGEWTAQVHDADGALIGSQTFTVE